MSAAEYRSGLITDYFSQYGYTPDPGVEQALLTAIGSPGQEGIISSEVGAYMNAITQLNKAASTDPMTQILADENAALTADTNAAGGYAAKLQDVYTQAPKLFGALTPDQIDTYLAPAKSAFDYSFQAEEGAAAKRGLTGSSVEANALATAGTNFNQSILSTGLNVGMAQQKNQADTLQNLFSQYMNSKNNLAGLVQGTGQDISQQKYANAQFLAQLPMLLNSMATQQMQLNNQQNQSSFWNTLAGTLGTVAGGVGGSFFGPMGTMAGAQLGQQLGTGISSMATGEPLTPGSQGMVNPNSMLLPLMLMGNKGGGNNMVPYSPSSTPNMNTAGSTLLPPGLSMPTSSTEGSGSSPDFSGGLNWSTQPGLLLGSH